MFDRTDMALILACASRSIDGTMFIDRRRKRALIRMEDGRWRSYSNSYGDAHMQGSYRSIEHYLRDYSRSTLEMAYVGTD